MKKRDVAYKHPQEFAGKSRILRNILIFGLPRTALVGLQANAMHEGDQVLFDKELPSGQAPTTLSAATSSRRAQYRPQISVGRIQPLLSQFAGQRKSVRMSPQSGRIEDATARTLYGKELLGDEEIKYVLQQLSNMMIQYTPTSYINSGGGVEWNDSDFAHISQNPDSHLANAIRKILDLEEEDLGLCNLGGKITLVGGVLNTIIVEALFEKGCPFEDSSPLLDSLTYRPFSPTVDSMEGADMLSSRVLY